MLTGEWTQLDVSQATNCFSDHSGVANDDGTMYLFGGYDQDYVAQTTVVKVEVSSDDTMTFSTTEAMTTVSVAVVKGCVCELRLLRAPRPACVCCMSALSSQPRLVASHLSSRTLTHAYVLITPTNSDPRNER